MALFGKPYEYSDYAPWGILKADSHFQTASRIVSTDVRLAPPVTNPAVRY